MLWSCMTCAAKNSFGAMRCGSCGTSTTGEPAAVEVPFPRGTQLIGGRERVSLRVGDRVRVTPQDGSPAYFVGIVRELYHPAYDAGKSAERAVVDVGALPHQSIPMVLRVGDAVTLMDTGSAAELTTLGRNMTAVVLDEVNFGQHATPAQEDKARAIYEAAKARLKARNYLPWSVAGGANECAHGIDTALACEKCDRALVQRAQVYKYGAVTGS